MLKKLVSGEYSLKVTFWIFGVFGFLFFNILINISQNSVLRLICPYGRICSKSIILFTLGNAVNLMAGKNSGLMNYLAFHFLLGACVVCYMFITLRGLWKSSDAYEGAKFWSICAKFILVCYALISLKSII